jgi:hypothetical protein
MRHSALLAECMNGRILVHTVHKLLAGPVGGTTVCDTAVAGWVVGWIIRQRCGLTYATAWLCRIICHDNYQVDGFGIAARLGGTGHRCSCVSGWD